MHFTYLFGKWGPIKYLGEEGSFQKKESLMSRFQGDCMNLASDIRFFPEWFSTAGCFLFLREATLDTCHCPVGSHNHPCSKLNYFQSHKRKKGKTPGVVPSTTRSHPVPLKLMPLLLLRSSQPSSHFFSQLMPKQQEASPSFQGSWLAVQHSRKIQEWLLFFQSRNARIHSLTDFINLAGWQRARARGTAMDRPLNWFFCIRKVSLFRPGSHCSAGTNTETVFRLIK